MAQRSAYRSQLSEEAPKASPASATAPGSSMVVAMSAPPQQLPPSRALAGEAFECSFLEQSAIDDYLAHASGSDFDPRYSVLTGDVDWSPIAAPAPLALCEFLAWKSVLAYHGDAEIAAHFAACNWRGVDKHTYRFFDANPDGDAQGFGFVAGDVAYIVMRGSTSLADWRANLDPTLSTSDRIGSAMREKIGGPSPERHYGFASAWSHVAPKVEAWVRELGPHARRLCFSGHSQGGALAIIGAHDFARRNVAPIGAVVTFASPKVGGADFVADYGRLGLASRTLRCESPEDAVTWLALHGGLASPGRSCMVDKRPMIAGMEKFWAALLFIAGWRDAKGVAKTGGRQQSSGGADKTKPSASDADAQPEAMPGDATTSKPDEAEKPRPPATEVDPRTALTYIALAVGAAIVFFVARKAIIRLRAHGAAKRYALFFSTLAYQRIRAARIADPANVTDAELKRASDDLDAHLGFIRGADAAIAAYAKLANRPIRALDKATFARLSGDVKAVADDSGPAGHYAGYIW